MMTDRIVEAMERHRKGYNCAQAVACSFCDVVDISEKDMFRLTEAFGFGMGNGDQTCGAVSGACVILGLKNSSGNLEKPDSKKSSYALSKELCEHFLEENKTTICKELKGMESGKSVVSCDDCIKSAVVILEKILFYN